MDVRSFFGKTPLPSFTPPKTKMLPQEEEEDEFECPRCNCVLRGDEANERRMWVSTDPEFLDPNEGYDVCDDCEEAACAEEKAKMPKQWKIVVTTQPKAANGSDVVKATLSRWRPDGYEFVDDCLVQGSLYDTEGMLDVAFNFGFGAHDDLREGHPDWDELELFFDGTSSAPQFYAFLDDGEEVRQDILNFEVVLPK